MFRLSNKSIIIMKNIDFTIDQEDLKVLYIKTKHAYNNISFDSWINEVKKAYSNFILNKENPKSFSQWINGQITYLS